MERRKVVKKKNRDLSNMMSSLKDEARSFFRLFRRK